MPEFNPGSRSVYKCLPTDREMICSVEMQKLVGKVLLLHFHIHCLKVCDVIWVSIYKVNNLLFRKKKVILGSFTVEVWCLQQRKGYENSL